MSSVTLSSGVRQNLLSLQSISQQLATTQNALATGKKVNSALDNAQEYFTSQALTTRANKLSSLLDGITNGINTVQAANNGITSITKLVQAAQTIVTQAQQATDTTTYAGLSTQYNNLLTQITALANDSSFNGVNLLAGNTLTVTLDEANTNPSTLVVSSPTAGTATGLSLSNVTWTTASVATDFAAAATALSSALTTLQSDASSLSSTLSTMQIRSDFTNATINTLQTGAGQLVNADNNEEGANLLALQTQQSLSTTALSLSVQSDRNVLKLFGG
jgi:flagellin-like hook-associated protein FlgL